MRKIRRVLVDSSVYGAAIEDEARYSVDSDEYWDVVYSKALFRASERLEIFGCLPIELELSEAPRPLREKLLSLYSRVRSLEPTRRVFELAAGYVTVGIFPPDALIASFASAHKVDGLVTVNRRHLKRPDTVRKIGNVNRRFRLKALRILLPAELLEFLS